MSESDEKNGKRMVVDLTAADYEPGSGVTPAVAWLVAINAAVYFLSLVSIVGPVDTQSWLGLSPATFPQQWWSVGTYMFVHGGFAHLATNMIMLWLFGPRVERSFGSRSFTYFYLWCGLGGAVFHLLLVPHGSVVGASGAVVGVVIAYALRWPDDEVYLLGAFPMRARWLAVWTIAVNVGMALANTTGHAGTSSTAWWAHVGGAAFALLYLHGPTDSNLERIRKRVSTVPDDTNPQPIPKGHRPKRRDGAPPGSADEAVARSNAIVKRKPQSPALTTPKLMPPAPRASSEDVNALLDKISKQGIESLSDGEKRLLDEMSKRLRGDDA